MVARSLYRALPLRDPVTLVSVGRVTVDVRDAEGKTRTYPAASVAPLCGPCTTRADRGGRARKSCALCNEIREAHQWQK